MANRGRRCCTAINSKASQAKERGEASKLRERRNASIRFTREIKKRPYLSLIEEYPSSNSGSRDTEGKGRGSMEKEF